MKNKLKVFTVFCSRITGEKLKANDFNDLIENRMSKRHKEFWSEVKFKDEDGETITINREFLDEQGMTFDEVVNDWKSFASEEELQEEI